MGKPVRMQLLAQASHSAAADISVRDSLAEFVGTLRRNDLDGHNALKRAFVRDILEAKFALCPRGVGASSFRIFEAMQLGRAPVIIADDWSPPPGPDWNSFAIFVPERHLARVPSILRHLEPEWQTRGQRARAAWEAFYSPSRLGLTIVRQAGQLLAQRRSKNLNKLRAKAYVHGPRRASMLAARVRCKIKQITARRS
jgi:hypothetical protein